MYTKIGLWNSSLILVKVKNNQKVIHKLLFKKLRYFEDELTELFPAWPF